MPDLSFLDWPFFEERHRQLARELEAWAVAQVPHVHSADVDTECRTLVHKLGADGWLSHAVGGTAYGGAADVIDTRAICIVREALMATSAHAYVRGNTTQIIAAARAQGGVAHAQAIRSAAGACHLSFRSIPRFDAGA